MPDPDPRKIKPFKTPEQLDAWLAKNHASETELWVKIFKKHTKKPSVTWDDIVVTTLCWGWIDGMKKTIDEESWMQRITPRKAKSIWSKRNTEHVERLIGEGRMQEAGRVHVRAAKADGRWESAYSAPTEMEIPGDFVKALESRPKAKALFGTLNKSGRFAIAYGLTSAKKPETRERRFNKYMDMLIRGEKPGSGF